MPSYRADKFFKQDLMKTILSDNKPLMVFMLTVFQLLPATDLSSQTEIMKWMDGKEACVSITFDDGSRNQFEIAIPILDQLEMPGTFFINTGNFPDSKYQPVFVGRPIMEIIEESGTRPTDTANMLERTSMIRYLREVQNVPEIRDYDMYSIGSNIERGRYERVLKTVDEICAILRESGKVYKVTEAEKTAREGAIGWKDLERYAQGTHEFACHTISHPHLSAMDEENILYELVKCREDIENHLGFKHTLSVECPFGIHDERVMEITCPRFPFLRNRVPEDYIDEILRSDNRIPGNTNREYIHWQRGPLSDTPYSLMCSWVDTSIRNNVWLVLVIHGIEGIGWEALAADTVEQYFNYIKNKEDDVWVATFQDAYKYVRERMNSRINQTEKEGSIMIEFGNELDKRIYDIPLSLKTTVPEDWQYVMVQQGDKKEKIATVNENGEVRVLYNVMPDSRPVILSKAL